MRLGQLVYRHPGPDGAEVQQRDPTSAVSFTITQNVSMNRGCEGGLGSATSDIREIIVV